jgi:P-type Mg2+ transporter
MSQTMPDVATPTSIESGGLSNVEAARRLARDGRTRVDVARGHRGLRLLLAQFTSPIVLILIAATVLAMALGDLADGLIILAIIAASGALGFWQEHTAGRAVDALLARVRIKVEVIRDGAEISIPVDEVVAGDVIVLRAGDITPADCRVLEATNLQVDESALTGESFPAEKSVDGKLFAGTTW